MPRRLLTTMVLGAALLTGARAQSHAFLPASFDPANQELADRTPYPVTANSGTRTQVFYGAAEVTSGPVTIVGLALRYDGPLPPTAGPGPFTMQRFVIRGGASDVSQPGSDFAANATRPLTTLVDGPLQFVLDQRTANGSPEPWEPTLTFRFRTPLTFDPATDRWLVFEFVTEGNAGAGRGHGSLDAAVVGGGPTGGSVTRSGLGCAAAPGAAPARLEAVGARRFAGAYDQFAPGTAYSLWATDLAPNQPGVFLSSLSDRVGPGGMALPLRLPGTGCDVFTGSEFALPCTSDASGSVLPFADAGAVPVPPDTALRGLVLHHQYAGVAPAANPLGVVTSDSLAVTLGDFQPTQFPLWMAAHRSSATATTATEVLPMGLAMRLDLQ